MSETDRSGSVESTVGWLGIAALLVGAVIVGRMLWAIVLVPTTEDVLWTSLQAIGDPALTSVVQVRSDACSITGTPGFGWSVTCVGIPRDPNAPDGGCRTVSWTIDP